MNPPPSATPAAEHPDVSAPRRARVMVVDDSRTNQEMMRQMLAAEYEVRVAADGLECLQRLAEPDNLPDLMLLDVEMPGMDGMAVLQALLAEPRTRQIPVIMVTASRGENVEERCLAAGAVDFVPRPVRPGVLLARVRAHLSLKHARDALEQSLRDVQELQTERDRMAGDLMESMKLESLSLTIAGIAHDLNTPIGVAITAASQLDVAAEQLRVMAETGQINPETLAKFLSTLARATTLVRNNLSKAALLVRSFKRTSADATRNEWQTLDLKAYLETLAVSVSPIMRRARCELRVDCPEGLQWHTEPGSLGQALTNLVVNASIHAFEGRDQRRIALVAQPLNAGLRLTVTDNGNGMSEEAITKAFTPFFTTKRGAGGSGLGLFSSRRVVEQVLGGQLQLHSRPGAGATFTIDLPERQSQPEGAVTA